MDRVPNHQRNGAPRIYLDTSAITNGSQIHQSQVEYLHRDSTRLVPDSSSTAPSVASLSRTGTDYSPSTLLPPSPVQSELTRCSSAATMSPKSDSTTSAPPRHPRPPDILAPRPDDASFFEVEGKSPFAFSPGHLSRLIGPKSHDAFAALGGLPGLERGLRTNVKSGLSLAETGLPGTVTFEEATSGSPSSTAAPGPVRETTEEAHSSVPFTDRKRVFGANILPAHTSKPLFQLIWEALKDKVLILLSIAAVVSLGLGLYQTFGQESHDGGARVEWIEGVAIIVAIAIVAIVGGLNDWQKERQFAKLNRKKEDRVVKVVRSGQAMTLSIHELVVGDVMILEQGDVIPVDAVLVDGHKISCDESSATGESDLVKKLPAEKVLDAILTEDPSLSMKNHDPFMISGSKVLDGVGTCLVTAVGENSSHGRTMLSLREEGDMTPLQFKLHKLAGYIAILGGLAGGLLFLVLFIEFLTHVARPGTPEEKAQNFMRILITSITIIVVAVPEGLPLAVTLALAFATKRMTKENNLVRHLQSCETMGNATVICSDKTGTLTENVMTVVAGSLGAGTLRFGDAADGEDSGERETNRKLVIIEDLAVALSPSLRELLKQSVAINTTAFENVGNEKIAGGFVGTKTETALLDWARRCFGLGPLAAERAQHHVVEVYPFNSQRKCMGTAITLPDGSIRLFIKGAPEVLLERTSRLLIEDAAGDLRGESLGDADIGHIKAEVSNFATRSLRTLGLCFRDFDSWPPAVEFDDIFQDIVWIGAVAIQDPVRKGVADAVRDCNRASVAIKMVTGDNVETARAIARECGLLTSDHDIVMEGLEFRSLPDEDRLRTVDRLRVLARSSPEDKRVLVKTLQSQGHIVAVTGDGTNDAPALKAADVGFSMGITGTEVAKEASDIILMDDNFSSIVKALAWGRAINDSVKKFLQFQITVNITAVFLTFITAVTSDSERSVLNAVQLLWVNLIMDTFAALALATDPPNGSLLDRKPEPKTAPLINLPMWKMIMGQSVYQLLVTLILYFAGPHFLHYPEKQHRTLIFNTFVFMQIFKLVNSRRIDNKLNILEGLHRNYLFMAVMAIMLTGQTLIVFVAGPAFDVTPLNGPQWGISLVLGFLSIPVGVLIRLFPDDYFDILRVPFIFIFARMAVAGSATWRFVRRCLRRDEFADKRRSLTDLEAYHASPRTPGLGGHPLGPRRESDCHPDTVARDLKRIKTDLDENLAWWRFRGGRMRHYEEKMLGIHRRQFKPATTRSPTTGSKDQENATGSGAVLGVMSLTGGMLGASIAGPAHPERGQATNQS